MEAYGDNPKDFPYEETKQETLTNDTDFHSWGFENFEVIKTEEDVKIFVETMENIPEPNDKLKKAFRDFNKQETLEEFAKNYKLKIIPSVYHAVIAGAKWQQEKMYSEEEVLEFTQTIIQQYKLGNTNIEQLDLLKETLEQFKNK